MMTWFRRHAAMIGMLGIVNFPTLPESPKPPAEVPVSLYVWNASDQPAEIAVSVDGAWVFREPVPAGRAVSRPEFMPLVEGVHAGEAAVAATRAPFTVTIADDGNRWLVVTWWGDGHCETGLQRQPPWIAPSS